MKKCISLVLCLCLIFSNTAVVFAESDIVSMESAEALQEDDAAEETALFAEETEPVLQEENTEEALPETEDAPEEATSETAFEKDLPEEDIMEETLLTAASQEEDSEEFTSEVIPLPQDETGEDLLSEYLYNTARGYNEETLLTPMESSDFSDAGKYVYSELVSACEKIAAGERSDSIVTIALGDYFDKDAYTAEDLGMNTLFTEEGALKTETRQALFDRIGINGSSIVYTLIKEQPYILYWFDRNNGSYATGGLTYSKIRQTVSSKDLVLKFSLGVTADYSVSGENGSTEIDVSKTKAAHTTAERAAEVVRETANTASSDYEKLLAYKDWICEAVDYNYEAAEQDTAVYGEQAWQIVYVFDGDPDTKVVCEGYSKAFKFLCDLTEFESPRVQCRLATGRLSTDTVSGLHMWNLITMRNGKTYLVDVTSSEEGSIGSGNGLFMRGCANGTERFYRIDIDSSKKLYGLYSYDDKTVEIYNADVRTLAKEDYSAENDKMQIADTEITGLSDVTYTGTAYHPEITVSYNGKTLTENTDYTLAYGENTNAGTGSVTVTGLGEYEGTLTKYFLINPRNLSDAVVSGVKDAVYDGTEKTQQIRVNVNGKELTKETDYTVSYTNNTDAGKATVIVTGKGNYEGSAQTSFTIEAASIETAAVSDIPSAVYTGYAVMPEMEVSLSGVPLMPKIDYTVEYENNLNAGTAEVTITGRGNYKGTLNRSFEITAAGLSDASVNGITDKTYTGEAIVMDELEVLLNGLSLLPDTDFVTEYSNNINAGEAKITITGTGNYTGSIEKSFTILPKDLGGARIAGTKDSTFTGDPIVYPLTVTLDEKGLTEGTDYDVTYENNTNVGTATVKVSGKGNYTGTASVTFRIIGASVEEAVINGAEDKTYTGAPVTQDITVLVNGETLTPETDYTVTYENNVNAGDAVIVINGEGVYGGEARISFRILPAVIDDAAVSGIGGAVYSGAAVAPVPAVELNGQTLSSETDYDLSYSNNTNVGTAKILITGKGNYTGTIEKSFEILAAEIKEADISGIVDKTFTGSAHTQNPVIIVGGSTLAAGTDYDLSYENNVNAGTASVTVTGKKNYKGNIRKEFLIAKADIAGANVSGLSDKVYNGSAWKESPVVAVGERTLKEGTDYTVSFDNNINAGTAAVTITGIGNYSGTVRKNFTIRAASISAAGVTGVTNKTFTGQSQTQNLVVTVSGTALKKGTDYTVSYQNNVNAGTAKMTIAGKGNYTGAVTKTFSIAPASVSGASVSGLTAKTYSGSAQTQNPTVKVGNATLKSGTDYTLTYSNNVNVGTAAMTITGKGNYTGSINKTFTIASASLAGAEVTGIADKNYTGKDQKPVPTVKVSGKVLAVNTDYVVSYKNNRNIGTATVTITGTGNYTGAIEKTFKINLKGTYTIASKVNKKYVMDLAGASKKNGANIQLYKGNKSKAQQFKITPVGKYYKIINVASGKALDVKSGKAKNKQNIQSYKYNKSKAQLWTVRQNSDGSIVFVSALNKKYVIDLAGGKAKNKTNIQLYKGNGSKAQRWMLTPVS